MLQMISGFWLSSCIHIAAKRSFADIIEAADEHQASIEDIAQASKVHPVWTRAILQALAKASIFAETEQHLFQNTSLSDCLRSDHPQTLKWLASVMLSSRSFILWSQLDYNIHEAGSSVFQRLWGKEYYELLEKQDEGKPTRLNPEQIIVELEPHRDFQLMLAHIGSLTDTPIAQAYPFAGSVCDLGGGTGGLLTAISGQHPEVEGILFERQVVIDDLKRRPIAYPFSLVVGDFFQRVPRADFYILHEVFHNWPDDKCVQILEKCAEANPDAKILVIEQLLGDPYNFAEFANIIMMLEQNGKERTFEEYKEIGKSAGFNQAQMYPILAPMTIVELAR
jgi:hypothetical protein